MKIQEFFNSGLKSGDVVKHRGNLVTIKEFYYESSIRHEFIFVDRLEDIEKAFAEGIVKTSTHRDYLGDPCFGIFTYDSNNIDHEFLTLINIPQYEVILI